MVDSDIDERPGQAHRRSGPVFDLITTKLRRPSARPGTIGRSSLIEKLARENSRPVVSVVAPAGYGKTTLLAQWAERNGQAFAWVQVDEQDNDPKVLLRYVAEALDAIEPVGERVFDALASPKSSVPGSVVPRVGVAFASMTMPVVLILDDVHLLHNRQCRTALSVLADHVPSGSRLVLSGRNEPPLRIARLRAEGRVLEIGPGDLSLTHGEAAELLRNADVVLGHDEVAELHRRSEGWPAALYIAALATKAGSPGSGAPATFRGDDMFMRDYLRSELLDRISTREQMFLTRTSVLERMSGPLCDATLGLSGSASTLAELGRSNMLLVPLDRSGEWYRYHHLFRDMLRADLARRDRDLIPVLRRRAAYWCLQANLPEEALEYFMAAEDVDAVADLVEALWVTVYFQGRRETVLRWVRWLVERGGIEGRPLAAATAVCIFGQSGLAADAERAADAVDRWQNSGAVRLAEPAASAWAALSQAMQCRRGVEQMRADADQAVRGFAVTNAAWPMAMFYQGLARVLCGDPEGGDASFRDVIRAGELAGNGEIVADALAERALLAMARGEWDRAEALAGQACTVMEQAGAGEPTVWAVSARARLHRGDTDLARQDLVKAFRLRPMLTYAWPHLTVQAWIEMARVHLALADLAGARTLMREIDELLRLRPGLGTLVGEAETLRARLGKHHDSTGPGASLLTAAELRLLPLLATHLSFPQIGEELFLSRNTIKSQAVSIYRKLDATSRNQAVARAREIGLLEG
jgi:LuxR family maltose regulon positive regulatory protein